MRDRLVVGDLRSPSLVHDVHGAAGASQWKSFAHGPELAGDWEAIEWARLPPGGVSGEHVHTRTEEVYFIVSGNGVILLDGAPTEVAPGDVILTGLDTRHGLRNTGDADLSWLVIEISSPATAAVLRGAAGRPPTEILTTGNPATENAAAGTATTRKDSDVVTGQAAAGEEPRT